MVAQRKGQPDMGCPFPVYAVRSPSLYNRGTLSNFEPVQVTDDMAR